MGSNALTIYRNTVPSVTSGSEVAKGVNNGVSSGCDFRADRLSLDAPIGL
jgi:hypothetical protein